MNKIKCLCFVLLCAAALGGCSSGKKQLSVSPYILINVSGLSGRASATIYLDTAGLYTALAGVGATAEDRAVYDEFISSFRIEADRLSELGNGDRVTVTVTYNAALAEELKINVTDFVKSVEIAGLDEGYEIDVFKDLTVEVTGIAPYAYASCDNRSSDPYISGLEYTIEGKQDHLENGDVITIRCSFDPEEAALYYYYTDVTTMDYTVEGLDSYIYHATDLDYDVLNDIAAECAQVIRSETEDTTTRMMYMLTGSSDYLYQDNNEWVESLKLNQVIFMSRKSPGNSAYENIIYYVFQAVIANDNYYEDGYYIFEYFNAIRSGSGEFLMGRNDPAKRCRYGVDFNELYSELTRDIEYQYSSVMLDNITIE